MRGSFKGLHARATRVFTVLFQAMRVLSAVGPCPLLMKGLGLFGVSEFRVLGV